jgi:hypothetical protein
VKEIVGVKCQVTLLARRRKATLRLKNVVVGEGEEIKAPGLWDGVGGREEEEVC